MKVYLPHINYTVLIKKRGVCKKAPAWMKAVAEKTSPNSATIYIKLPISRNDYPTLVHELIHVLQYICASRNIDFTAEQEHMAYIGNYIFNKATGFHYV